MSFKSGKLTILSILISSILLTAPVFATEAQTIQSTASSQTPSKSFPETLQSLIDAPGKKDFITIPMPTEYYETNYKKHLDGEWNQRKEYLQEILKNHTITEKEGVTLVTLNTNISEAFIKATDLNNKFHYSYVIANGYVLKTKISTYFSRDDSDVPEKMDYLTDMFTKYLVDKGFKEETTIINYIPRLISKNKEFRLGDHIVILKRDNDLFSGGFYVIIQNKLIEDNLDDIMKDVKVTNMNNEYKALTNILK